MTCFLKRFSRLSCDSPSLSVTVANPFTSFRLNPAQNLRNRYRKPGSFTHPRDDGRVVVTPVIGLRENIIAAFGPDVKVGLRCRISPAGLQIGQAGDQTGHFLLAALQKMIDPRQHVEHLGLREPVEKGTQ